MNISNNSGQKGSLFRNRKRYKNRWMNSSSSLGKHIPVLKHLSYLIPVAGAVINDIRKPDSVTKKLFGTIRQCIVKYSERKSSKEEILINSGGGVRIPQETVINERILPATEVSTSEKQ